MSAVFADTVYFLALLNPADQWHGCARDLSAQPPGALVTTEFIMMEVGDALSRPADRLRFARLLELPFIPLRPSRWPGLQAPSSHAEDLTCRPLIYLVFRIPVLTAGRRVSRRFSGCWCGAVFLPPLFPGPHACASSCCAGSEPG
jgi:hypothetical protein